MTVPASVPTGLGLLAVATTSAVVAIHALVGHALVNPTPAYTNTIAIASSASEGIVLVIVSTHLVLHIWRARQLSSADKPESQIVPRRSRHALWLGLAVFACTAAAAISLAALITLGRSAQDPACTIFGASAVPYLAGASVALGSSYSAQFFFLIAVTKVAHSAAVRSGLRSQLTTPEVGSSISFRSHGNSGAARSAKKLRLPKTSPPVKSIPYTKTTAPVTVKADPTPSSIRFYSDNDSAYAETTAAAARAASADKLHSARSSLVHDIRPMTSRTRLIPSVSIDESNRSSQLSSVWRQPSFSGASTASPATNTYALRELRVRPSTDDFDSWDTSAVDPQTRQTVMESSALSAAIAGRCLQTIPASPEASCTSGPGLPVHHLKPHPSRRRSRSISSMPSSPSLNDTRARSHSHSQVPPPGEAHIHPLFRSDSLVPPPAVSAGTVVLAAPNGGQFMASDDAQSLRALNRKRSETASLVTRASALSRQTSVEDFGLRRDLALAKRPHTRNGGILAEDEAAEAEGADRTSMASMASSFERKMTPPIPEWILTAGMRTSLTDYQGRKTRVEQGAQ